MRGDAVGMGLESRFVWMLQSRLIALSFLIWFGLTLAHSYEAGDERANLEELHRRSSSVSRRWFLVRGV